MFLINPYILQASSALDADAQAFITTASITDSTQQSAINQLVLDLKSYSIWSKLEAIYPYVGGNATSHSYNLKDTTQFQITWSGGVTHDSNGITGNGTNAYGNTGLVDSTVLTNYVSMGVYSRTSAQAVTVEIGAAGGGGTGNFIISNRSASGMQYFAMDGTGTYRTVTNGLGLAAMNRTSSSDVQSYKNGVEVTATKTENAHSGNNIYVLARKTNTTIDFYSARNLAFAFIGNSLTTTEQANLYTAIQTYQTTLSRQV
jgi:hypothetical protein